MCRLGKPHNFQLFGPDHSYCTVLVLCTPDMGHLGGFVKHSPENEESALK